MAPPQISVGKRTYVEQVVELAGGDSSPPRAVLEAGVGIGVTAVAVAQQLRPDDRFSAIDLDPVNIAALQAKLGAVATCQVDRLVVGDIRAMNMFQDQSFDVVCSDTTVALLGADVGSAFGEILRVLRPGGALVIRELLPPNRDGTTRDLFLRVVCAARMLVGDGYAMLPPDLIGSVLEGVGFAPATSRVIREIAIEEDDITQWYPLSDPEAPLRAAFVNHYRQSSSASGNRGGSVADSYLLVAVRPH